MLLFFCSLLLSLSPTNVQYKTNLEQIQSIQRYKYEQQSAKFAVSLSAHFVEGTYNTTHDLRHFLPNDVAEVQHPEIFVMIELRLCRTGKLTAKYPQLSTKVCQSDSLQYVHTTGNILHHPQNYTHTIITVTKYL